MRAVALWLLSWVTLFAQAAPGASDYNLTVQPVWDGFIKPGGTSELGVRFLANSAGSARLSVQGSLLHASAEREFEPGIPLVMYLPVSHDGIAPVILEVSVNGQPTSLREVALQVLPTSARIVAVVAGSTPPNWPDSVPEVKNATVLHPAVTDLPRSGHAYNLLSALFLSGPALQSMDSSQRQALSEYTGACGVLYLNAISAAEERGLRTTAGCGGRNVITFQAEAIDTATQVFVKPLPDAAFLEQLVLGGQSAALRSLAVFLSGYVLLLLLVARSTVSVLPLVALPPVATALAVLGWSLGNPVMQAASWAEMHSGDSVVRFSGIVQVVGMSRRMNSLALPMQLGLPISQEISEATELHIAPADAHYDLHLFTHLMSLQQILLRGVSPGPYIEVSNHDGAVRVVNRGETPSASGLLAWRGERYSVPGLAAGQEWQKPDRAEPWGDSPQEQLLRQRGVGGGSWMLVPFQVPAFHLLSDQYDANSWLLVEGSGDV